MNNLLSLTVVVDSGFEVMGEGGIPPHKSLSKLILLNYILVNNDLYAE